MIPKFNYIRIIRKYEEERNLNRLVYRIVKYEPQPVDLKHIFKLVDKILKREDEIKEFRRQCEMEYKREISEKVSNLENQGYGNIFVSGDAIHYTEYFMDDIGKYGCISISALKYKHESKVYKKFYHNINEALENVIRAGWVEPFMDKDGLIRYKLIKK